MLVVAFASLLGAARAIMMPIDDPTTSDKFQITYANESLWDTLVMKNKTALESGELFDLGPDTKCFLPNMTRLHEQNVQSVNDPEYKQKLIDTLDMGAHIIDASLKNQCLVSQNGFWTYRYCGSGDFTQYHGVAPDPNDKLTYTLGRSSKQIENREFQLLYDDYGYYISEIIESGDICDVTGTPRAIEIQYTCGNVMRPGTLQWTRETKICHYEAQVIVPDLCQLELLSKNQDKKNAVPIICHMSNDVPDKHNIVDIVSNYDVSFVANQVYFLLPMNNSNVDRALLMYTGNATEDGLEMDPFPMEIYKKFIDVMNKMLGLGLLSPPDGKPFDVHDSYQWIGDIVDMHGNYLNRLRLDVDVNMEATLIIDKSINFTGPNNFQWYFRGSDRTKNSKSRFGSLTNDNMMLAGGSIINVDDISKENAQELLEKLVAAGKLSGVIEDNKITQGSPIEASKTKVTKASESTPVSEKNKKAKTVTKTIIRSRDKEEYFKENEKQGEENNAQVPFSAHNNEQHGTISKSERKEENTNQKQLANTQKGDTDTPPQSSQSSANDKLSRSGMGQKEPGVDEIGSELRGNSKKALGSNIDNSSGRSTLNDNNDRIAVENEAREIINSNAYDQSEASVDPNYRNDQQRLNSAKEHTFSQSKEKKSINSEEILETKILNSETLGNNGGVASDVKDEEVVESDRNGVIDDEL